MCVLALVVLTMQVKCWKPLTISACASEGKKGEGLVIVTLV